MAVCNFEKKEINCKVFYFGADYAGKTENLRALYRQTSPQVKSKLFALETSEMHNPIFDFLPLQLGEIKGYKVRIHAFTLPASHYAETYDVLLKGIDGFVFVIDSNRDALITNIDAWRMTADLLETCGGVREDLPQVCQYNKRDATEKVAIDVLRETFNPHGHPDVEAIATRDIGTMESLEHLATAIVTKMLAT